MLFNTFLNQYNSLFIVKLLKIQLKKFNWGGNGATLGRLGKTKILLPVDTNNQPDYAYMEKYIKNIFAKKYNEYVRYAQAKL